MYEIVVRGGLSERFGSTFPSESVGATPGRARVEPPRRRHTPETRWSQRGAFMTDTTETPVLDLLASMTAGSIEAAGLDPETLTPS
jgi:hypothetical protein